MFNLSSLDAEQVKGLLYLLVLTVITMPFIIADIIEKRKIKKRLEDLLK